jgi:hypothetical protein
LAERNCSDFNEDTMRVLVTGATGFIGGRLSEVLREHGHSVVALSRNPEAARRSVQALEQAFGWDPEAGAPAAEAFDGVDAVIHLAGESVVGRWSEAKKKAIRDSRVLGTSHLVRGIAQLERKPQVLISSSAIGYYGDRGDEELTETSKAGSDFLANTCQEWEQEARKVEWVGVRSVMVRTGIVLGPGGGALEAMLPPFKLGAGGPLGSGLQWWSWIHRDDLIGLMLHGLAQEDLSGPVNGTAPHPQRQKEFARVLGRVLRRPAFLPAPAFVLRIVLGGFSTELLSSKRVLPKVAEDTGYRFQHPELEAALRHVLGR